MKAERIDPRLTQDDAQRRREIGNLIERKYRLSAAGVVALVSDVFDMMRAEGMADVQPAVRELERRVRPATMDSYVATLLVVAKRRI